MKFKLVIICFSTLVLNLIIKNDCPSSTIRDIEMYKNENYALEVVHQDTVIYSTSPFNWIMRGDFVYEAMLGDSSLTIIEFDQKKLAASSYVVNHTLVRKKKPYFAESNLSIIFDISVQDKIGFVYIPGDSGRGIYRFSLENNSDIELICKTYNSIERILINANYLCYVDYFGILKIRSLSSGVTRTIGKMGVDNLDTLVSDFASVIDNLLIVVGLYNSYELDITNFNKTELNEVMDFFEQSNNVHEELFYFFTQEADDENHIILSSSINSYCHKTKEIQKNIIIIPNGDINYFSIDRNGHIHISYLTYQFLSKDDILHDNDIIIQTNYVVYDLSSKRQLLEEKDIKSDRIRFW